MAKTGIWHLKTYCTYQLSLISTATIKATQAFAHHFCVCRLSCKVPLPKCIQSWFPSLVSRVFCHFTYPLLAPGIRLFGVHVDFVICATTFRTNSHNIPGNVEKYTYSWLQWSRHLPMHEIVSAQLISYHHHRAILLACVNLRPKGWRLIVAAYRWLCW